MSNAKIDSFLTAGLAACTATVFSNPAEVAKTRLQLQGELVKKTGNNFQRVYLGPIDAIGKAWRLEGISGVQRGLGAAVAYSSVLQMSILGLYEPFRQSLNRLGGKSPTERFFPTNIAAGTCTGIVGALLGNPFFLVKARMQAFSPALPVGTQRYYRSSLDALLSIYKTDGFRGLFRGAKTAMIRTPFGTSVQMPTYFFAKGLIVDKGILGAENPFTVILSSAAAGAMVCLSMSPADTTLTRQYNQPTVQLANGSVKGTLYTGPLDCLIKTVRIEGPLALYKGASAHFLRITPHITILLTANEYFTRWIRG